MHAVAHLFGFLPDDGDDAPPIIVPQSYPTGAVDGLRLQFAVNKAHDRGG